MSIKVLTGENFDAEIQAAPLAMVDFWADWCGPCKMVSPVIDGLAAAYDGKVFVGKVNVDDEPELAEKFQIQSIPNIVFFKNGQMIDRKIGVMPEDAFRAVLDANL